MEIASFTSVGLVRQNNEDSCLILPPWSNLAIKTGVCAFGIADGMGGENSGEIASKMAIDAFKEWIPSLNGGPLNIQALEELYTLANNAIWEYAQKDNASKGMGTTLTVFVVKEGKVFVGHIGDSRLYRFRNDKFEQLTSDHTLVAEQVKLGKITREDAKNHPSRHILSRVLGGRQFVVPDVFELDINLDDKFLMCTDGIYGLLNDDDMAEEIAVSNVTELPKTLVMASDKAGGRDNSTAIAFKLSSLPITIPGFFSLERIKKYLTTKSMVGFI